MWAYSGTPYFSQTHPDLQVGEDNYLLGSTSLGNSQTDTEDGIGAKLGLVGSAIELVEEGIDLGLVLDVDGLLDQGGSNDTVDVVNGLGYALAAPLGLVAISELTSLVLAYILGYCLYRGKKVG